MRLRLCLAGAVFVSLGLVSFIHATDPMVSDFSKTKAVSDQVVRGDVLMREGEFSIVKDVTGHEVRVHVNKETKLNGTVKVGDKIEARATEGHATSLTRHIPQHGTTPVMPGRETTFAQQSSERLAQ